MQDIYFEENYGKIYEKIENGEATIFKSHTKNGTITNQFIKREIPITIDKKTYYDIITPYGYGGPIINECLGNKKKLLNEYELEFTNYCMKNNIVSEFIRFHPIYQNALDFKEIYNATCIRKTLGTNLEKYDNPIQEEFSKSCRKNIRQALNKGISYRITEAPDNIDVFKKIYYSTMDRNNATKYYYFDDEYFDNILQYFKNNTILVEAIYEGKTIACGLYFIYNKIIHIHLSGTLTEYLYLSPAYILRYAITLWGKEHNYKYIHHGGGRSNTDGDSLYLFKKQFAKNTAFDFYIGKKIWNEEIYYKLCCLSNGSKDDNFFPQYRKYS